MFNDHEWTTDIAQLTLFTSNFFITIERRLEQRTTTANTVNATENCWAGTMRYSNFRNGPLKDYVCTIALD